jgi:hypothetical protein
LKSPAIFTKIEGEMMKKYYYVVVKVLGYGSEGLIYNTAISMTPAEYIKRSYEKELDDGPYVILYAEEISEKLFKWFESNT